MMRCRFHGKSTVTPVKANKDKETHEDTATGHFQT